MGTLNLRTNAGGSVIFEPQNTATDKTVFVPASSGTMATTSQLSAFRNRVINGDMRIAQRTLPITSNGTFYGVDRFQSQIVSTAGGTVTHSRGTMLHNGRTKFTAKVTVASPGTNFTGVNRWEGFNQFIEGYNFQDLVGQPLTVSFLFRSNVTGKHSVRLGNGDGGYLASFNYPTAGVIQYVTVTTPPMPDMVNFGNSQADDGNYMRIQFCYYNAGSLVGPESSAWALGAGYTATGSVNWTATIGNYIEFTEVQVEAGTVATPFEVRPHSVELALCQRYYNVASNMWISGQSYSTSGVDGLVVPLRFPVEMRANPTITFVGGNDGGSVAALFSGGVSTSQVNINLRSTGGDNTAVWFSNFATVASSEL